ncbi:MAG TPA: metalloregulator ArsR/SmtB family transcription factor [Sphaerochaeta sp.]|nr:winged helix-turn-helix transcriptional regulator [Spirochaetales bacterium]HKM07421.1 metalloregulator ArsR/SmtB family transcription factor [Sphaerochaeta sp.]
MDITQYVLICKALGDRNRLEIILLLTKGEQCACEMLKRFSITQPTLSHHMRILTQASLVEVRKDGKWSYYSINCPVLKEFRAFVDQITCSNSTEKGGCSCR